MLHLSGFEAAVKSGECEMCGAVSERSPYTISPQLRDSHTSNSATPQTQNICITFIQRRPNVEDVGPALYKCFTNVSCLLGPNNPGLITPPTPTPRGKLTSDPTRQKVYLPLTKAEIVSNGEDWVLNQCWAGVCDTGPAFTHHRANEYHSGFRFPRGCGCILDPGSSPLDRADAG